MQPEPGVGTVWDSVRETNGLQDVFTMQLCPPRDSTLFPGTFVRQGGYMVRCVRGVLYIKQRVYMVWCLKHCGSMETLFGDSRCLFPHTDTRRDQHVSLSHQ